MLLRMFGIGTAGALAGGSTEGIVTEVTTCYWFKVNTKAVRTHMGDGAEFPHIIHFTYQVDGVRYTGRRWVMYNRRCPVKEERITVHYEENAPQRYAVMV